MRLACMLAWFVAGGCHREAAPVAPAPPPPPHDVSCVQVREHVEPLLPATYGTDSDALRRVAHAFTKRCLEDAWSGAVRACVVDAPSLAVGHRCLERLPAAQLAAFDAAVAHAAEDPDAVPPGSVPASCLAFGKTIERLLACDAIPQASRDALRESFQATRKGWDELSDDGKRALDQTCRDGNRSLVDAFDQMCPHS